MKDGPPRRATGPADGNQEVPVNPVGLLVCAHHEILGSLINHVLLFSRSPELKIRADIEGSVS